MTRTEKLLLILIVLVVAFMSYITYLHFGTISKNIRGIFSKFRDEEVIVPYDKTVYHIKYNFKTVKETYDFKPKNIEDIKNIYYTVLNNGWNDFVFYCPKEYENCINDVKSIADGNTYLSLLNNYVHPYNTYVKYNTLLVNNKEIHLSIEKLYSNDDIEYIENKINEIFNNIKVNKNGYKSDNIKKIHNYIIENTHYDADYRKGDNTISNKANGALKNGIALCSGYSDLFAIMLTKLSIPNFRVSNDEHIWNVIYNDNKWSHIDVTWDDDERNKNNTYNFYLISTDELHKKDDDVHIFNINDYLELK